MLLLVTAMGYGIVRPTLGDTSGRIAALGVAYFGATCALEMGTNVGTIDDLRTTARVMLVLPVALLDAGFIVWTFTSLSRTLAQLQARRAGAKLALYRAFTNLMALAVLVSVVWIGCARARERTPRPPPPPRLPARATRGAGTVRGAGTSCTSR